MKSKHLNFNWKEISQFLEFLTEGQKGYFEIRAIKGKVVAREFFKSCEEMVEWLKKKEKFLLDKDVKKRAAALKRWSLETTFS